MLTVILVAALFAACDDTADTTTTTDPETTTTTAPAPPGRAPLQPNGPAIARQGDQGAIVEAIQFYLVCVGVEQPDPEGPLVAVDGSFGPITAFAVAYFQAQIGRAPSGAPDDETFARMARECGEQRSFSFPIGESTVEIAGNAAPGDDEVFAFDGAAGQILRLSTVEGVVDIAVEDAEGAAVGSGTASVDVDLPAAGRFLVRVSASAPTTFRLQAEVRSPNVLVSEFGPMVLRGDGVGVADLGTDADNAAGVISLILGSPWTDSGWQSDVAACPGTHRAVTWLVQAGLGSDAHPAVFTAFFSEVSNEPIFLEYTYHTLDLAALDPLAQGLGTVEGISIGSTFEQFTDAYEVGIDAQGRVTPSGGPTIEFAVVGDTASPDPTATRVNRIGAGTGGCAALADG